MVHFDVTRQEGGVGELLAASLAAMGGRFEVNPGDVGVVSCLGVAAVGAVGTQQRLPPDEPLVFVPRLVCGGDVEPQYPLVVLD